MSTLNIIIIAAVAILAILLFLDACYSYHEARQMEYNDELDRQIAELEKKIIERTANNRGNQGR